MMNVIRFAVPCSLLLFAACGGDDSSGPSNVSNIMDPVTLCDEMARHECQKIYACANETLRDLAMLPKTEAECVSQLQQTMNCPGATANRVCSVADSYTLKQANTCIDQVNSASCEDVRNYNVAVEKYVPACGDCVPF